MQNPIDRLEAEVARMTNAQRCVADYIIKNPLVAAFSTIEQMAAEVGTSTTTIMRLMSAIGYSGYSEFQRNLQNQLRDRYSPATRLEANLMLMDESDLWGTCYNKQMSNITQTFSVIPAETLDRVVDGIAGARSLYFAATRGGMMVAQYLHSFLSRMFASCFLLDAEKGLEWSTVIPNLNGEDMVLAIGYPRYAKRLTEFLQFARQKNVQAVVFTDGYASPLAAHADIVLPCACGTLGFHNSPLSAMMLADCIINVISIRYAERIKGRLDEAGKILSELGYYST